jgi:hypothetical protein
MLTLEPLDDLVGSVTEPLKITLRHCRRLAAGLISSAQAAKVEPHLLLGGGGAILIRSGPLWWRSAPSI